jgi:hypothetical protein
LFTPKGGNVMATGVIRHLLVTLEEQKELEKLSPFELKIS